MYLVNIIYVLGKYYVLVLGKYYVLLWVFKIQVTFRFLVFSAFECMRS